MSKYGWISEATENYLNMALKERVLRWVTLNEQQRFPEKVKSELECRLIKYLVVVQNNPGHNDRHLAGLIRRIKDEKIKQGVWFETGNKIQLERSRAHKYRGSVYLSMAISSFKNQQFSNMPGLQPRSLKGNVRMKTKARDLKLFMKEVQRRYEVIDRMYSATVRRKSGRVDQVSR
jgi:hypothetical protein